MNLHANAALSLKSRRELCRRVVERERRLAQAAEAHPRSPTSASSRRKSMNPRRSRRR